MAGEQKRAEIKPYRVVAREGRSSTKRFGRGDIVHLPDWEGEQLASKGVVEPATKSLLTTSSVATDSFVLLKQ